MLSPNFRLLTFEALRPFAPVEPSASVLDPEAVPFAVLPVALVVAAAEVKKMHFIITASG